MKFATAALLSLLSQPFASANLGVNPGALEAAIACNQELGDLDFVFLEDEAVVRSIEDDVRSDLAAVGFNVVAKPLNKADLNVARQAGDFHLSISETWGLPYDPHSFAQGWIDGAGGEGIFPAMVNFDAPSSRQELLDMVEDVLETENPNLARSKWYDIHKYYHEQAVLLPLYGKRIPTLLNRRLSGYESGYQQFDYPVQRLRVVSGSKTVTIAPGARAGLFHTVGTMNAHVYGPNEFFSNNWVYEGLVAFGPNGGVVPALAVSWTVTPNELGGDTYTFQLREGVTFHDGAAWNCDVAKLNFDHVLALQDTKHSWYGVGTKTEDWFCNNDMEFVLRTNAKHESYLNELSLIRPTRMMSPNAFVGGLASDPTTSNSCHTDWGSVEGGAVGTVDCVGIETIAGTGPFKYVSKEQADGTTNRVTFAGNTEWWGGTVDIEELVIVRYTSDSDVKEALLNGELDIVWGAGVLSDSDIMEIASDPEISERIQVGQSDPIQTAMMILNTGAPPLDDINVRKTVIHAINKGAIVQKELPLASVVDNVFPRGAPYCDVELTPRWSYDFEKAVLLSCGGTSMEFASAENLDLALGLGLGIPLALVAIIAVVLYSKNASLKQELDMNLKEGAQSA